MNQEPATPPISPPVSPPSATPPAAAPSIGFPGATPVEQFLHLTDDLYRFAQVLRHSPVMVPLALLILRRIRSAQRRFVAIAARVAAGTYLPPRPRPFRPRPAKPEAAAAAVPPPKLPRRKSWLSALLRHRASAIGFWLSMLIEKNAEMRALLAAAPELWRILRPLLHACGGDVNLVPKLPPRGCRRDPVKIAAQQAKTARRRDERAAAAAVAAAERAERRKLALNPRGRAYRGLRPQDSWMPHHPVQVRARLRSQGIPVTHSRPKNST